MPNRPFWKLLPLKRHGPAPGWLDRQPADFQEAFRSIAEYQEYESGDKIWRVGQKVTAILGVIEGCVALNWTSAENRTQLLHLWWPGDWTGDAEFISGSHSFATQQARTDTKVVSVPHDKLRALLDEHPRWWSSIAELGSEHSVLASDAVMDLMVRDPVARCIAVLLRAGGGRIQSDAQPASTVIPISQGELAIMANLHRNTVSHALKRLADEGLIKHEYRCIELMNISELRRRVIEGSDYEVGP